MVRLRDYGGWVRQLAVDGLGHAEPTLFLSNNVAETARNLIIRYAGRNRVEDGLGSAVNFFHLDCLASEVRLNVDLDTVLTVLANGCYRWLGRQLRGFEKAAPKQLYRRFVEISGAVLLEADRVVVQFDRRCHNPVLREAALDRDAQGITFCLAMHRHCAAPTALRKQYSRRDLPPVCCGFVIRGRMSLCGAREGA